MAPADRTITLAGDDGEVEKFVVLGETGVKGRPGDVRGFGTAYLTLFQGALAEIAANRGLTRTDLRVWLAAMSRASLETPEFDARPAEIGALLGMDSKAVIKTVSRLVEFGLLRRPRRGKLALPPEIAWRGTVPDWKNALRAQKETSP